jgi:uncharacterized protein with PIN domain
MGAPIHTSSTLVPNSRFTVAGLVCERYPARNNLHVDLSLADRCRHVGWRASHWTESARFSRPRKLQESQGSIDLRHESIVKEAREVEDR